MVLMSAFFASIKVTLLFFYKRLFLVPSSKLRVFWWANLVYVVLWFFGGTGFYLFQCQPVQWYFMQYYARFGKPVPGGITGQCDATTVAHVALPMVFSLISDIGLLVLPICAIWNLRLSRWKKVGLYAVFGIGFAACLLELARILALLIDTDDKTDPSCKLYLAPCWSAQVPLSLLTIPRWCGQLHHLHCRRRDDRCGLRLPTRDRAPGVQILQTHR